MKFFFLPLIFCLGFNNLIFSRTDSIPAKPRDVESIDAIIKALYDVISGPAGEVRNWDRMRSLFLQEAMMVPTGYKRNDTAFYKVINPETYISVIGPGLISAGFFETEISHKTEQYGNIAQVFSTYESRNKKEDVKPFMRGINSIQLWYSGSRWYIVSIIWLGETPSNPLPSKYLN